MAHHTSDRPFKREPNEQEKELQKKLVRMFENRTAASDMQPGSAAFKKMVQNLGATGEYPEGQLSKNDEGAIRFAVGAMDGKVLVDFGTPVRSLGMGPDDADAFAQSLMEKARMARNQQG